MLASGGFCMGSDGLRGIWPTGLKIMIRCRNSGASLQFTNSLCLFVPAETILIIETKQQNAVFFFFFLISCMRDFKDWSLFDDSIWVSFYLSKFSARENSLSWSFSLLYFFKFMFLCWALRPWFLALYLIISFTFYSLY